MDELYSNCFPTVFQTWSGLAFFCSSLIGASYLLLYWVWFKIRSMEQKCACLLHKSQQSITTWLHREREKQLDVQLIGQMWSVDKVRVCSWTQTGYLIFDLIRSSKMLFGWNWMDQLKSPISTDSDCNYCVSCNSRRNRKVWTDFWIIFSVIWSKDCNLDFNLDKWKTVKTFIVVSADSANKKLRSGFKDIVAFYMLIGLLEGAPVIVEAMSSGWLGSSSFCAGPS